jgi:hypothetical protein
MGMHGAAAQFRGINSVLMAYENQKIAPFAVLWGKQFLFSYSGNELEEGKQLLQQWLTAVSADNPDATATYTLRLYDGLADKEKIKAGTDYDASFNFKLADYDQYNNMGIPRRGETAAKVYELEQTVLQLKQRLEEEENEEEEKPGALGSIGAMLQGLLEHPEIKQAIAGKLVRLFDNLFTMQPQQLGQIAGPAPAAMSEPATDEITRLNAALAKLYNADPDLINHLEVLATMAEKETAKFQMLISMLK